MAPRIPAQREYSRVRGTLNNSNISQSNNPLYQTLNQLIGVAQNYQDFANSQFGQIANTFNSTEAALGSINGVINGLIDDVAAQQQEFALLINRVAGIVAINIVEVDTSAAAQTVSLVVVVQGATVIKDISGNASVNNITLDGTVDGIVNPVINTDYGVFHVYGRDPFFSW